MRVHIEFRRARVSPRPNARAPPHHSAHWVTRFDEAQTGAAFEVALVKGYLVFTWSDHPKSHIIVNDLLGVEACCDGLINRTRRLHRTGEHDMLTFAYGDGVTKWRHEDAFLRADAVVVAKAIWEHFQRAS